MTTAEDPVRRHRRRPALLVAALLVCALLTGTGLANAASGDYIVVLRDGVSVQAHLKGLKITPNRVYSFGATGYEAWLNNTQYQRELASPDVTIVSPNIVVATVPTVTAPMNDPTPSSQFVTGSIRRIGGLSSPTAAIDGIDTRVNVDVAIVDTGVDATHPDLNVAGGVDCSGNNGAFRAKNGHGTMVAGLVGAVDNTTGIVGVAPGARIWSVQVTNNEGSITDAALLCAVDWITGHASTMDVANLSLGGVFHNQETENCGIGKTKGQGDPIHAAICASVAAGVTYVVSAGNDSVDAARIYPASYDEVITASAFTDTDGMSGGLGPTATCLPGYLDDHFAPFSNFGQDVDVAAPGVCVVSTFPGGLYAVDSGTSFSAPLVSGAAALYLSTHPGATPANVKAALLAAAEPGPITGDPDTYPEGVVNVSSF